MNMGNRISFLCITIICSILIGCSSEQSVVKENALTNIFELKGYISEIPSFTLFGKLRIENSVFPLAYYQVHIGNTDLFDITDEKGEFVIEDIPIGTYNIVVFIDGEKPYIKQIEMTSDSQCNISIPINHLNNGLLNTLSTKNNDLIIKEILNQNKSNIAKKEKYIMQFSNINSDVQDKFLRYVIGNEDCKILNPHELHYSINETSREVWITYTSDVPIEIIDQHSGYYSKIVINKVTLGQRLGSYTVKNDIIICFEDLLSKPWSELPKGEILKNRKGLFTGSKRHFLCALSTRRINEEGFGIYVPPPSVQNQSVVGTYVPGRSAASSSDKITVLEKPYSIIQKGEESYLFNLRFDDILIASAQNNSVKSVESKFAGVEKLANTYITLMKKPATFNSYGNLINETDLIVSGYWSVDLISKRLPANYFPDLY